MSMTDPLGDMLTRIRNGQQAQKSHVVAPASNLRESVLEVLKREGYIRGFERVTVRPGIEEFKIELKYHKVVRLSMKSNGFPHRVAVCTQRLKICRNSITD